MCKIEKSLFDFLLGSEYLNHYSSSIVNCKGDSVGEGISV
jgi:hypothetical protein